MNGRSRAEMLQALREVLLAPAAVTAGFSGVDVLAASDVLDSDFPSETAGGDAFVVVFRWKRDPTAYALTVPAETQEDGTLEGVWTGTPVESGESWVQEVTGWLMEQLDTGLVRRAPRVRRGDVVHLLADDAPDVPPPGYYVGAVYLGPGGGIGGEHLAEVGLDVTLARALREQGRLLTWVHAYADTASGEPMVGHAVVSWDTGGTLPERSKAARARLAVLETATDVPRTVAAALAFHALRNAAEAGALVVVTDLVTPVLNELGFRTTPTGQLVLRLEDLKAPRMNR